MVLLSRRVAARGQPGGTGLALLLLGVGLDEFTPY
jgi:hypothetical protein